MYGGAPGQLYFGQYAAQTTTTYLQSLAGSVGALTGGLVKSTSKSLVGKHWFGGNTEIIRPIGNGNYQQWSGLTGASLAWQAIDESPSDDDTSYIAYVPPTDTGLELMSFTMEDVTVPEGYTITSVTVKANLRLTTAGTPTLRLGYRYSGTDYIDTQAISNTTYETKQVVVSAPAGGWDITELNGMEALVGIDAGEQLRVTQLWVEVVFTANAGTLSKLTNKFFSGTMGNLSGALTTARIYLQSLAGAITLGPGVLTRQTNKALSGATGTLSGVLSRLTNKSLAGTMGALTGTLASASVFLISLSGAVGSISGSLVKQINKPIAGVVGELTGSITKRINKSLSGATGSLSGVLTSSRIYFQTLAGSITMSGTLSPEKIYRRVIVLGGNVLRTIIGLGRTSPTMPSSGSTAPTTNSSGQTQNKGTGSGSTDPDRL